MKYMLFAAFAAALISAPFVAKADSDSPNPAAFQAFAQVRARMQQLHAQARLSALNALTPAHRTLLAQVVGQLAIAPNADVASAARLLDSNLSPGEAQAILDISRSMKQQARQIMTAARQQFENSRPAGSAPQVERARNFSIANAAPTDPGMILLRLSIPEMGFDHHG